MADTETINAEQARELIAGSERVLVLDLRSEDDFGEGHIPGARNLPDASEDSLPDDLPEEGKVLLCGESSEIASTLSDRGLEVVVLEKGIDGWRNEKLPEQPSSDLEKEDEGAPKLPGAGT